MQLLREALADQYFCDQAFGDLGGCYDIGYQSDFAQWLLAPCDDPLGEQIRQIEIERIQRHWLAYQHGLPPSCQAVSDLLDLL